MIRFKNDYQRKKFFKEVGSCVSDEAIERYDDYHSERVGFDNALKRRGLDTAVELLKRFMLDGGGITEDAPTDIFCPVRK